MKKYLCCCQFPGGQTDGEGQCVCGQSQENLTKVLHTQTSTGHGDKPESQQNLVETLQDLSIQDQNLDSGQENINHFEILPVSIFFSLSISFDQNFHKNVS